MPKFKVTFVDEFETESKEDCYDRVLDYLSECVKFKDVTAFEFEEIGFDDKLTNNEFTTLHNTNATR
jgi:hypothetical protein